MSTELKFDQKAARRLDAIYAVPDVVAQRQYILDRMNLTPGDSVLDIGSGPGYLAQSMGSRVGAKGQILGVDASESMCEIARVRCAAQSWISFKVADATILPLDDNCFDIAVSSQVYEFVEDVEAALLELVRVIKPGGRALVLDTDWDSIVWHSTDTRRMQRILKAWEKHLVDPYLPRTLGHRLVKSGFKLTDVEVVPLLNAKYDPASYSVGMLSLIGAFVRRHSEIEEGTIAEWKRDLQQLGTRDEYFFSLNRYLFSVEKPV